MFVSLSTRSLALTLAATSALGCATQGPGEGAQGDTSESSSELVAWISVEQLHSADQSHTNVSAKFLRVAEHEREAIDQLLGARPALPSVGECAPIRELDWASSGPESSAAEGATGLDALTSRGGVAFLVPSRPLDAVPSGLELLDVGDVILRVRDRTDLGDLWLAPRAFPEIGELVSGVFYTSPDASRALPVPAHYAVRGTGSSAAEAFLLDVAAPSVLSGLNVGGAPLAEVSHSSELDEQREPHESPVVVHSAGELVISWAASAPSSDVIYVDIGGSEPHRCSFVDDGRAIVPASLLWGSASDPSASPLQLPLTIHRFRELREAITVGEPGATSDEQATALVRFDLDRKSVV